MRIVRQAAWTILLLVFSASLFAGFLAPAPYAQQFRDTPEVGPSKQFPLGTDELGRDRLSRLLYGSRVSLLLAPSAALLSTLIAACVGGVAAYAGGRTERVAMRAIDLFLSLPWLFLLLTVRAMMPLNIAPWTSVIATFALLGLLGWAGPARIIRAGVHTLLSSDFVLQARACGCSRLRLLAVHLLPNLKPILHAQFWIAVPFFILAEANLGLLGLGVSEPLPSWGNLLRGLERYAALRSGPWILAPVVLLVLVTGCLEIVSGRREAAA